MKNNCGAESSTGKFTEKPDNNNCHNVVVLVGERDREKNRIYY